ncbi:MAG: Fur family transcriptional regulator [Thermoleophilia bacterium]
MDQRLADRWLELAQQRLAGSGRRLGAARAGILDILAREGQCLVGALEISDKLRARGEKGSQASVYRVLDELHGLGLLHRAAGQDGVARYEIADPHEHHHHFVDDETGDVKAFTDPALERAIDEIAERLGVELSGHEVVLRGRRSAARS